MSKYKPISRKEQALPTYRSTSCKENWAVLLFFEEMVVALLLKNPALSEGNWRPMLSAIPTCPVSEVQV